MYAISNTDCVHSFLIETCWFLLTFTRMLHLNMHLGNYVRNWPLCLMLQQYQILLIALPGHQYYHIIRVSLYADNKVPDTTTQIRLLM